MTTTVTATTKIARGRAFGNERCARAMLGAVLGAIVALAHAADIDHDTAQQLRARGTVLSLASIVAEATERWPGQVIESELSLEDGRYVYEIELLCTDGQIRELEYDAASGELLEVELDD